MAGFSYRIIHDRPNQRLRVVRTSSNNYKRTIQADLPLDHPVEVLRLDGGQTEGAMGRRTVVLKWGAGEKEKVNLVAGTSTSMTLEDEATLLTLDDGSAYDFSGSNADNAGSEMEEILRRIIRQTGFRVLWEGVVDLDDAAVKTVPGDLKDVPGGTVLSPYPDHVVGMSVHVEAAAAADYVRYTVDGVDPVHSTKGKIVKEGEVLHLGQTPETPEGDATIVSGSRFRRSVSWTTGAAHVTLWGLQ